MTIFIGQENLHAKSLIKTADPTVLDDSSIGIEVGWDWINSNSGQEYVCVDNSVAGAVWKLTTFSGATGGSTPSGPATGDLGGSYPAPTVIAFTSGGIQLLYKFVGDGQVLQRQGNNITSVSTASFGGGGFNGTGSAHGDLAGSYPSPTVIAFTSGGVQQLYQFIGDGQLLQRQGNNITSVNSGTFALNAGIGSGSVRGDLTGTLPTPSVVAFTSGGLAGTSLSFQFIGDGQLLQRKGNTITSVSSGTFALDANIGSGSVRGDLTGTLPIPKVVAFTSGGLAGTQLLVQFIGDGQLLQRQGTNITSVSSGTFALDAGIGSGSTRGDLTGTLPIPKVIAFTSGGLSGQQLLYQFVGDGQLLQRQGNNITSVSSGTFALDSGIGSGSVRGDLTGTLPLPKVMAFTSGGLAGVQLLLRNINDGEVLQRIGTTIASVTTASWGGGGPPSGPATGDLSASYPSPSVIAFTSGGIGGTQLLYQFVGDGQVLQRQGNNITSVSTSSFGGGGFNGTGSAYGDLTGSYPSPAVIAFTSGGISGQQLLLKFIGDGQLLQRQGNNITSVLSSTFALDAGIGSGSTRGDLTGTLPVPKVIAFTSGGLGGTQLLYQFVGDGQLLQRQGTNITSVSSGTFALDSGIGSGSVRGDLTGTLPIPKVIAFTSGGLAGTSLPFQFIGDGQLLQRQGNAITSVLSSTFALDSGIGSASVRGDLTGTLPLPKVIAFTSGGLSGQQLLVQFVGDGQLLQRQGNNITSVSSGTFALNAGIGSGSVQGDLTGTLPAPKVIAFTSGGLAGTQLLYKFVGDGQLLQRQGTNITSVSSGTFALDSGIGSGSVRGDLTGTLPVPKVIAFTSGGLAGTQITFANIVDGEFLKRVGTQIVSTAGASGPPNGAATGDLSASYPNPTVVAFTSGGIGGTQILFKNIFDGDVLQRQGTTITSVSTASFGGGSPSAPVNAIQFNSASAFGGTSSVKINYSGSIETTLPIIMSAQPIPPPPNANTVGLFGRKKGGRMITKQIGPSGLDVAFQPAIFENTIRWWMPSSGGLNAKGVPAGGWAFNWSFQSGGIPTNPITHTGSYRTQVQRANFRILSGTGIVGGLYGSHDTFYHGDYTGSGGYYFACRFSIPTGSITSGSRCFIGLASRSVAIISGSEIDTQTHFLGVGWNSTDATASWYLMRKDASTEVKETLTASSVHNTIYSIRQSSSRDAIYDLFMFSAPGSSTASISFIDVGSSVAIIDNYPITGNLPSPNIWLKPHAVLGLSVQTASVELELFKLYGETDL